MSNIVEIYKNSTYERFKYMTFFIDFIVKIWYFIFVRQK